MTATEIPSGPKWYEPNVWLNLRHLIKNASSARIRAGENGGLDSAIVGVRQSILQ